VIFNSYKEGLITYFNSDSLEKPPNLDIDLIEDNIDHIRENIKTDTSILFFNDEPDLSARLLSLSDWIRSYIVSINYLSTNRLLKNTLTLQEILHDFSEITKVSTDYDLDDDNQELEKSYQEISNYVVASISHIYNESNEEAYTNE
jgi:uncharacterized protein YgfB (UPF0149 family)